MNTSAKPGCNHKDLKFLKAQEVHYCPDCGGYFGEDPRAKAAITEVMPTKGNLMESRAQ